MSEVRQPFCEKLVLERIDGVTNFQSDFYKRIAVGLGELGTSKSIPALDNLLSNVDAIAEKSRSFRDYEAKPTIIAAIEAIQKREGPSQSN